MFDKDLSENEQEVRIESESRIKPLIGVFLVLASVVVYIFLVRPVAADVSEMKVSVATQEKEMMLLEEKIEQFDAAKIELNLSNEVQRREILKTVPKDMDQDEVIRDLVDIADTYDVNLNSVSFGRGTSGKENVSVLKVNASLEGDYDDLTRFLQGIEQNARLFRVNTISVQISSLEASAIKRATFSLSMEAFFQENN